MPTHLDVFVGLQFAEVLLQEEQIQWEIVPLVTGGGQDAHGGQWLVGFQEAGISMAEEGTETGVDHRGNQRNEQNQVDKAGKRELKKQAAVWPVERRPDNNSTNNTRIETNSQHLDWMTNMKFI